MRKPVIVALCAGVLWAQNPNTAVYPGAVATDTNLLVGENLVQSPLTANITATSTTLPVANAAIFRVPTAVIIDSEIIKVCAKDTAANTLTVCSGGRGFDRTTAASHASGTMVRATIVAHYHNQVAAEIKAIENTLGPNLSNVRTTINAVGGASNLDTVGRVPFTSATGIVNKSTLHFSSTSQRLGIGVTDPQERLDILGRLKLRDDGNNTAGIFFNDTDGSGAVFIGKNAANNLIFRTGGGTPVAEIRSDRLQAPVIDSGGTVVHVKAYGAVGDGVTDDTTAWQNALNAVAGTGRTLVCGPGTYKTTASLIVSAGNFTIQGPCTIKPTFSGTGQFSAITWSGSAGTSTTVTADVNTDRANSATDTISVASTSGFAVDDYVYLVGSQTTGSVTNQFAQVVRVKSVGESSLTFYTPVVIPIRTTDSSSVVKVNLLSNITLRNLTFDGENVTAPNTNGVAIRASYYKDSVFENLTFLNWRHGGASNTSAAIVTWIGLNNRHRNISIRDSGSGAMPDYAVWNETALMTTNLSSIEATGHGPKWRRCTHCIVDGVTVLSAGQKGTSGRGVRIQGVAWSHFSNLYVARSKLTGVSVFAGTYRTVFSNISAVQNENEGIWFPSEDNIYNTLLGVNSIGNSTADIAFYSSSKFNAALVLQAGTITSNDTNFVAQMRDGGWQAINFGTKPTCSASVRGMTWFTRGAAGVKDGYEVCAKDASDTYAWQTIY